MRRTHKSNRGNVTVEHTLTAKEIKDAVARLKETEIKPKWRLTWRFPFIEFYYEINKFMGSSIDIEVKRSLRKV